MGRRFTSLILAIVLLGAAAIASIWLEEDTGESINGRIKVVDGDSLEIGSTRIRLSGIDAPEGQQAFGRTSTEALRRLTERGDVHCSNESTDRYDRVLAVCFAEKRNINRLMVRGGYAWDYRRYSHGKYASDERAARKERLGLWGKANPVPPWDWRRSR